MFTVQLFSFNKKENSTARPSSSSATSFNCKLLKPSGVLNPAIELDIGLSNSPARYNYAYIQEFDRYYWIEEWTNNHPLWQARLSVDVLATYKTVIGASDLYVLRASASYDGNIIDTLYPTKSTINEVVNVYDKIFNPEGMLIANGVFVIGVVSTEAKYGSITYYQAQPNVMKKICEYLLNTAVGKGNLFDIDDASFALQKSLIDPLSYIKSAIYLPFNIQDIGGGGTQLDSINIWDWEITDLPAGLFRLDNDNMSITKSITMTIPKHPNTNSRGNYMNVAPYTSLTISIPPFNNIEVDTLITQKGGNIVCNITVDRPTGRAILECYSGDSLVGRETCQLGVPIQLSQVTKDYVGALQSAVNGVGGALDIASGKIGSGFSAYVNGFVGSAVSLYKPIQSSTGSTGALGLFVYPPKLFSKFQLPVDDDISHHGRPLCQVRKPSTLGGYMLIQDADISINGTSNELSKIRAYLEGGFYYE